MSAIVQAITPNPHTNLLNVLQIANLHIANKRGFQRQQQQQHNIANHGYDEEKNRTEIKLST
jgi:hypothetical protein